MQENGRCHIHIYRDDPPKSSQVQVGFFFSTSVFILVASRKSDLAKMGK